MATSELGWEKQLGRKKAEQQVTDMPCPPQQESWQKRDPWSGLLHFAVSQLCWTSPQHNGGD